MIPDLRMDETPQEDIGKYGRLRETYLKEHMKGTYLALLLEGKLQQHLLETERTAQERIDRILTKLKVQNGVTEKLKSDNQMEWVRQINSLTAQAEEMGLLSLTDSALNKLQRMSDAEYAALDLFADFGEEAE